MLARTASKTDRGSLCVSSIPSIIRYGRLMVRYTNSTGEFVPSRWLGLEMPFYGKDIPAGIHEVIGYLRSLMCALAFLASLQLCHGDVKSENVCYSRLDNLATLIDFEHMGDSPTTRDRGFGGTVGYLVSAVRISHFSTFCL